MQKQIIPPVLGGMITGREKKVVRAWIAASALVIDEQRRSRIAAAAVSAGVVTGRGRRLGILQGLEKLLQEIAGVGCAGGIIRRRRAFRAAVAAVMMATGPGCTAHAARGARAARFSGTAARECIGKHLLQFPPDRW